MSTFSAKGSDIDVEAIMANIRRKIEEKRKGFYTEEEVREIADMKLDAVLDSSQFNSDFVAAFRARDAKWNYSFGPETIYASSRSGGGGFIRAARRLLHPVLKLFFNPNPMISALSRQSDLNRYYVVLLHNMALEMTRMNLELSNIKGRLRTLGIRVDFQGKREKTLEGLTARESAASSGSASAASPSASDRDRDSLRRRQRGGRRSYRRRRGGSGRNDSQRSNDSSNREPGGGNGGAR